jgi:hypothetical protein
MATKPKEAPADDQASTSTDVALKQQQALATMNAMFTEDAGAGFEEADASAYAIPFLLILQSGSPQCKKSDGAYIKGAEEGMFFNTVTQEIFPGDVGLTVIPVHYSNRFIEWKLRESGGGFVAEHLPGTTAETQKDDKGRDILPNGNVLVDTRNHYVLIEDAEGNLSPALITMSSTQLKKSRQWMSKMQGIKMKDAAGNFITAPMASRKYQLTTTPENNDKGSWFGFRIELSGIVDNPATYKAAVEFRDAVKSGVKKANFDQQAAAAAGDTTGDEQF